MPGEQGLQHQTTPERNSQEGPGSKHKPLFHSRKRSQRLTDGSRAQRRAALRPPRSPGAWAWPSRCLRSGLGVCTCRRESPGRGALSGRSSWCRQIWKVEPQERPLPGCCGGASPGPPEEETLQSPSGGDEPCPCEVGASRSVGHRHAFPALPLPSQNHTSMCTLQVKGGGCCGAERLRAKGLWPGRLPRTRPSLALGPQDHQATPHRTSVPHHHCPPQDKAQHRSTLWERA